MSENSVYKNLMDQMNRWYALRQERANETDWAIRQEMDETIKNEDALLEKAIGEWQQEEAAIREIFIIPRGSDE